MPKKTKSTKDLAEELKSLNKEVQSLSSTTKTTARDVASVTKSLKNSKQIAKAAKSANAKVTESDVNRINQSLEREKQLSKIVDKMSGTLTKSDVNAIERSLQYGKELAKLSRSLSGKIGANEIRILNKALIDAREVKRITNSLSGKSASGMAKPLKKVAKSSMDSDTNVSATLTYILASVSAIPKMAEDIETLTKIFQDKSTKEKISEFKTLEASDESAKTRQIVSKEDSSKDKKESSIFDFLGSLIGGAGSLALSTLGAAPLILGGAGLGAAVYNSLSESLRNTIDGAIKYIFSAIKQEVRESVDRFKQTASEAISNPTAENIAEVGKSGREDLRVTPGATVGARVAEKTTRGLLSRIPFVGKYFKAAPRVGLQKLIPKAGPISGPLSLASRTFSGATALSDEEQKKLGADTKLSAVAGSFLGGNEDDWWLTRAWEGGIAGGLVGGRGGPWGAVSGAALGITSGIVGPKATVATIDTMANDISTYFKMATDIGYSSIANLYYYHHLRQLKLSLESIKKKAKMSMTSSGELEYSPADQLKISSFESAIKDAEAGLNENSFNSTIVRLADLATDATNYSKKKWAFANSTRVPEQISSETSIPGQVTPELLTALVLQESRMNPNAISPAGAMGLTQLMPSTAKYLGVERPFDPKQNLTGGLKYLNQMIKEFGSVEAGLAAYNVGPGAFEKLSSRAGSKDVFAIAQTLGIGPSLKGEGQIPQETLNYVPNVLAYLEAIKQGQFKENLEYVQNTLGKEAFESSANGQNIIISNSFNNTQLSQPTSQSPSSPEVPEGIQLEYAPNY